MRQQQKPPEDFRPCPAKKNTRKWCKGKVGRAHTMERMHWVDLPNFISCSRDNPNRYEGYAGKWMVDRCSTCGKVLWLGR